MGFIFVDGFDTYTSYPPPPSLWQSAYGGGTYGVGSSYGRFSGSQGLHLGYAEALRRELGLDRSTLFVAASLRINSVDATSRAWLFALSDAGALQLELRIDNQGHLAVTRNGTVLAASTQLFGFGKYRRIEFKATIDPTAGGYELRVDEDIWLIASGVNTRGASTNNVNRVDVGIFAGTITSDVYYDDVMIWDDQGQAPTTFIGDCRIQTKVPSANGTRNDFAAVGAASNWSCVDEIPADDDTSYVSSGNIGDEDRYVHPGNVTGSSVVAVVSLFKTRKDDASPRSVRAVVKSGASIADNDADFVQSSTYAYYQAFFPTDPSTGSPWTIAAVNAMEFGVKVTA